MRRLGTFISALLLLSACRRAGTLPPDEVLRRTIIASAQLESVSYDADVDVSYKAGLIDLDGDLALRGVLARGGDEGMLSATLRGSLNQGASSARLAAAVDVVRERTDTYFLLTSFTVTPPSPLLPDLSSFIGRWWKSSGQAEFAGQDLSPDPEFLRSQAEVVTVTDDHGLESVNGRDAYRYSVALDPERMIALMKSSAEERGSPFDATKARAELDDFVATGELLIDAETFVLHRISWTVESKDKPASVHVDITANFTGHGKPVTVTIPATAELFRPEMLFQTGFPLPALSGAVLPQR